MSTYLKSLSLLKPSKKPKYTAIDLFAGCGGLALGFESAGIETIGYEMDKDAVQTYNRNLEGHCTEEFLSISTQMPEADLVIGGPPCQPFSVGGKQLGLSDSRDGFPIFISAVERIKPKIWMFENVRGMLYRNNSYLSEIISALQSLGYKISYELLNAVNFGVPQNRERLIVIGHSEEFFFPNVQSKKYTAGEAIKDLATQFDSDSKFLTPSQDAYIKKYELASKCVNPRDLHLDRPSRTVTCRNLAGATGDMHRVKLPDGRRRRITIREAARLQSFPDWFEFSGCETSVFNQIGNAVPPMFAYILAKSITDYLEGKQSTDQYSRQMAIL